MMRCSNRWGLGVTTLYIGILFAMPATAQRNYEPDLRSTGHPDLTGIWEMRGTANWNLEGHSGGLDVLPFESVIVDPPDGTIPTGQRRGKNAMP